MNRRTYFSGWRLHSLLLPNIVSLVLRAPLHLLGPMTHKSGTCTESVSYFIFLRVSLRFASFLGCLIQVWSNSPNYNAYCFQSLK